MNENQDSETHWYKSDPRFEIESEPEPVKCKICFTEICQHNDSEMRDVCFYCIDEYKEFLRGKSV